MAADHESERALMDRASYMNHARAWEFVEAYASARTERFVAMAMEQARATSLNPSSAMQAALLSALVRLTNSASVISVGTGNLAEVAALIDGLDGHGQLTAVDSSLEGADAVRALIRSIGESSDTSLRAVHASPGIFLPRLNAQDYDLIVVSGQASNYSDTLEQSHRLLGDQGVIVFTDVLAFANTHHETHHESHHDESPSGIFNPADRSVKTVAMRGLLDALDADERIEHTLLPVGTGVCIAFSTHSSHSTHSTHSTRNERGSLNRGVR